MARFYMMFFAAFWMNINYAYSKNDTISVECYTIDRSNSIWRSKDSLSSSVDIDNEINDIEIFPNPVSKDEIEIVFKSKLILERQLSIEDISGKLVIAFPNMNNTSLIWDLKNQAGRRVSAGVYFLITQNKNKKIVKKIIVE